MNHRGRFLVRCQWLDRNGATRKMKFSSGFLAILVIFKQILQINMNVEGFSGRNRFENQILSPLEAKWRLVFNSCGATCGGCKCKSLIIL
jgi:hypothetical protein